MAEHHQDYLRWLVGAFLALLMAAGITQPGGAGTTIYIYDDSDTSGGRAAGPYTNAQISAAFPVDWVDNGTQEKSYRAKVSLQIGDTGTGTASTTYSDTQGNVFWDAGKTLIARATQTTSWLTSLGSKVGTGNTASGRLGTKVNLGLTSGTELLRGKLTFYGVALRTARPIVYIPPSDLDGTEFVNCIIDTTLATGNALSLGVAATRITNMYNVDFTGATTGSLITSWGVAAAKRLTMAVPTPTTFFAPNAAATLEEIVLIGSPTTSDMRWTGSAAIWNLIRPTFTGNAPKFSATGAVPNLANSTKEYWGFDVKVVDRNGNAIAGIPVKLTDVAGVDQVDTTTLSTGDLAYGSGATANHVIVADHYVTGANTYTLRQRSPFEIKCNMPDQVGYNPNYLSRHYKFNWPGSETYTTSSGTFEDMNDVLNLEEQSGTPTSWIELEMP